MQMQMLALLFLLMRIALLQHKPVDEYISKRFSGLIRDIVETDGYPASSITPSCADVQFFMSWFAFSKMFEFMVIAPLF